MRAAKLRPLKSVGQWPVPRSHSEGSRGIPWPTERCRYVAQALSAKHRLAPRKGSATGFLDSATLRNDGLQAVCREECLARDFAASLLRAKSGRRSSSDLAALDVSAGKFDTADCAILRVSSDRRPRVVKARIENIMTMFP